MTAAARTRCPETIETDLGGQEDDGMRPARTARMIPALIVVCSLTLPAPAQYSGGSGAAEDPYQIATAEDLIALGETPEDYDKHFKLMADIDLSGYVYDRAVIAADASDAEGGFQGTPFAGVLDGNGHTISRLTIEGGSCLGLFGQLGLGATISNLGLERADVSGTGDYVGGLVGCNYGSITTSYSTGTVSGVKGVGGLVGEIGDPRKIYSPIDPPVPLPVPVPVPVPREVTNCYSIGTVSGSEDVGGLVGAVGLTGILGIRDFVLFEVSNCYSAGTVRVDDSTPPAAPSIPSVSLEGSVAELSWEASTEDDVIGYEVHYGSEPDTYTGSYDATNVTSFRLPQKMSPQTAYMAVSAYDSSGNSSLLSEEVRLWFVYLPVGMKNND